MVVDKVPVREVQQKPPVPVPASKQQPIEAVSEAQPQTAESTQAAAEPEGFTLQFETDDALEQLVARHEVGLYAINEDQVMRMAVENGRAGFWTASLPDEYHEMDARTVPKTIVDALRFAGYSSNTDTHWGVTLPSATAQRLNDFVSEYRGGALIIGASGSLRLEQ
jgi:hypothetical protein